MLGLRERMEENGSAPGTGEAKRSAAAPADPEVVDRPLRRRFSPSYKLRIVEEADRCTEPGEVGQLLRREGLYSSHLTTWRKAAHSGSLKALSKKRGRKPERNPLDEKVRKLERRNARLENELRKAHLIIDVQGKAVSLPVPHRCAIFPWEHIRGSDVDTELVTTREASRMLGYTVQHVRRLIQGGSLRGVRLGRDWLVLRASVDVMIARRENLHLPLSRVED